MKAIPTGAPIRKAISPPMKAPPMPTKIVVAMVMGFGPGTANRPRAPMIRPLMMVEMMNQMKAMAVVCTSRRSGALREWERPSAGGRGGRGGRVRSGRGRSRDVGPGPSEHALHRFYRLGRRVGREIGL